MNLKMHLAATILTASIGFAATSAAEADVFTFSYNIGDYNGHGVIKATKIFPSGIPGYGTWLVNEISGVSNGDLIITLSHYAQPDLLLQYYPATWHIPLFDWAGISWATNDNAYNVYYNGTGYSATDQNTTPGGGNIFATDFLIPNNGTLTVSSVPEPATWVLFGVGFLGLGLAGAKRRAAIA